MVAGRVAGGHRHRRRPHPRAWPANWPAPSAPWCTAESACAIRNSAAWPAGSSTSSTSSPGTSTSPADRCSRVRRRGRSPCSRSPASRTVRRSSAGSAPACAARRKCSGQVPVSCLAEEIATPGEGQIKALITVAGNPVLSTPAGHKLDEVLPTLDAMIAVDLWLNETTRHADVILPGAVAAGTAASRRPDPQLRDQQRRELLAAGVRARRPGPAAGVGDPDPADGAVHRHARRGCRRRGDRRRVLRLHGLHPGPRRGGDPQALRPLAGPSASWTSRCAPGRSATGTARTPTVSRWTSSRRSPNGINFGQMVPRVPEVLGTADGKIRLAPQYLLDDLPRLARTAGPRTRRAGAGQQAAPAVQQLVAAQRRDR